MDSISNRSIRLIFLTEDEEFNDISAIILLSDVSVYIYIHMFNDVSAIILLSDVSVYTYVTYTIDSTNSRSLVLVFNDFNETGFTFTFHAYEPVSKNDTLSCLTAVAFRECNETGHWHLNWTNYSQCLEVLSVIEEQQVSNSQ